MEKSIGRIACFQILFLNYDAKKQKHMHRTAKKIRVKSFKFVKRDGYKYGMINIDTCSSELNLMWYRNLKLESGLDVVHRQSIR